MMQQHLPIGSTLQDGKYKIDKVLGQGGFGITYLAWHTILDKRVAIKEFFFNDYCERDRTTNRVTIVTQNNHQLVERFLQKFIKEARTIARLEHSNIVHILDVFKENNTAYYVMEYLEGESLAEKVKRQGALPEAVAVGYIKQVASALSFIHQQRINHLDVKPANIMVRKADDKVVVIDFGLSKQYDEQGGQTSTTPVGISHGYAPMEQYNAGGVSTFSPQADIYALGATLYKLVTGSTPPQAIEVFNEGLPALPSRLSKSVATAIEAAMRPGKKERPESIELFLQLLNGGEPEEPEVIIPEPVPEPKDEDTKLSYSVALSNAQKPLAVKDYKGALSCFRQLLVDYPEHRVEIERYIAECEEALTPSSSTSKKKNSWLGYVGVAFIACLLGYFGVKLVGGGEEPEPEPFPNPEPIVVDTFSTVSSSSSDGYNGHSYVDLGLSVKWATCNVGASSPEDYGSYFAWGEVLTKSEYTSDNSKTYGKSNIGSIAGNVSYDAARSNWGRPWRLPTKSELEELENKCRWTWTSQGGKNGYKVTGPNGNSIFLPAAGYRYGTSLDFAGSYGYYWSATPYESSSNFAYVLYFDSSAQGVDWYLRDYGHSVRPVAE